MKNNSIFISHGMKYEGLVVTLREAIENQGLNTRVVPEEVAPGDELEANIKVEIEQAGAFIAVIGPDTINSSQVVKEIKYALEVNEKEADDDYKVIPLLLAGVKSAEFNTHFANKLVETPIQIGPGGINATISQIVAVLNKSLSDKRESTLFAGIENSLRRLSPGIREKIKPLGVFQGGGSISNIANVLQLNDTERDLLVSELREINLAKPMPYGFLHFHPSLCPFLKKELDETTLDRSRGRWSECLRQLSEFLYKQQSADSKLADELTLMELPNLIKSMEYVQAQKVPEVTLDRATLLEQLIAHLDKPDILAKVKVIQEEEKKKSSEWNSTRFETLRLQVEKYLEMGNLPQALSVAQVLLDKCLKAGDQSYEGADHDTAEAYVLLGRVLRMGGASENALQAINEALKRFELIASRKDSEAAGIMASATLAKKGECLLDLDRLDESAAAFEECIRIAEKFNSKKHAAIGKGQLGTVRLSQERYEDAIKAHDEAREIFEGLGDLNMVAVAYQQMGAVHEEIGQFEEAEQSFQKSLAISEEQKNLLDQAKNLGRLGSFYAKVGRTDEAVTFLQRSSEKYVEINNMADEGRVRGNLSITLITLKRYEEARQEIQRAIECFKPYGHNVEPWRAWDKLSEIELADDNQEAAAQAREQAVQLYLAFRRDGGEDHNPGARLCTLFYDAVGSQPPEEVKKHLDEVAKDPKIPEEGKLLISKLQSVLTGSREKELASDPDLDYIDAAEILFLLEKLEKRKEQKVED
jgi:Tetratricopeptide repeat.